MHPSCCADRGPSQHVCIVCCALLTQLTNSAVVRRVGPQDLALIDSEDWSFLACAYPNLARLELTGWELLDNLDAGVLMHLTRLQLLGCQQSAEPGQVVQLDALAPRLLEFECRDWTGACLPDMISSHPMLRSVVVECLTKEGPALDCQPLLISLSTLQYDLGYSEPG